MPSLQDYVAFVAIDQGDLYRLRADGSEFTRLTTNIHISAADMPIAAPTLSPDGAWLALVAEPEHGSDVYLIRPDGRNLRRLSNVGGLKFDLHWSPDSRYLAFAGEAPSWNVLLYSADTHTGQSSGLEVNLQFPLHPWYANLPAYRHPPTKANDHRRLEPIWIPPGRSLVTFPPLGYGYIQGWVRNNTHVLFRTLESAELFIIESQGERFYPWTPAVAKPAVVGVRPDGQLVAYGASGGTSLYLHHLDENEPSTIPHDYPHTLYFSELQWSPDGRYLAYNLHHQPPNQTKPFYTTSVHIATIADGTTLNLGRGTTPYWLPDGSHLTYRRLMHPYLPSPTQPVRYDLATGITTPLIAEIAEMELSPWYWMPR
jgi:tricorn protease-like protein